LLRLLEVGLDSHLASETSQRLLFHAAALIRNNRAIVLPGDSGWGKSTLTLALAERGYSYLSDEFAVLDPRSAQIEAFPKPISIRDPSPFAASLQRYGDWLTPAEYPAVRPESVRYVHPPNRVPPLAGQPAPVGFIIFPRYDPTAITQLTPLEPDEVARRLLSHSVNLPRLGGAGIQLVARLVAQAQCYALTTSQLDPTCRLLDALTGAADSRGNNTLLCAV
jgi:hypothetical protein